MNCCDTYGNCDQGDSCPTRTGVVTRAQSCHAKRVTNGTPAEAGNVWFVEPDPIALTRMEAAVVYTMLTVGSVVSVGIIAGAAGWLYGWLM